MRVLIAFLVLTATVSAFMLPSKVNSFEKTGRGITVNGNSPLRFRVALQQQNMEKLEAIFWDITNPKSDNYRQWLSREQVTEMISLPEEQIQKVISWLKTETGDACEMHTELSVNKDYIIVNTCLNRAQSLFPNLALVEYFNPYLNINVLRHQSLMDPVENKDVLSIPAELHEIVNAVFDLTETPAVPHRHSVKGSGFPGENITPSVLRTQYSVPSDVDGSKGTAGIGEFDTAAYFNSDLKLFQSQYNLPSNTPSVVGSNDGSSSNADERVEASLDIQYILAVANSAAATDFHNNYSDFLDWGMDIGKHDVFVHSVSWGSNESAYTKTTITAASNEFMKLGTQGYTIMYSSGDDGPGNAGVFTCSKFNPDFPASSPYVTAVGATYLTSSAEVSVSFSGGGFSTYFNTPSYQSDAVSSYLSSADLPSSSKFNSKGRGYPDVAAFGTNYQVYVQGSVEPVAGTSCSSPAFASIIASINSQRAEDGKSRVGFINQAIYQAGSIGQDITSGANIASGCSRGFNTAQGWDPVSGLGSPDFSTLMQALE